MHQLEKKVENLYVLRPIHTLKRHRGKLNEWEDIPYAWIG